MESVFSVNKDESLWLSELPCGDRTDHVTTYLSQYPVDDGRVLLINALSGAVDVVSKDVAEGLAIPESLPNHIRAKLQVRGYLFRSREAEVEALHEVYGRLRYRAEELPVSFVICPTYQCNFRCPYCYEGHLTRSTQLLSEEQLVSLFQAIQALRAEYPYNPVQLELFGGEPLQQATAPVVERVFEFACQHGFPVSIITNGSNIENFAPLLFRYRDVIAGVGVTIDGAPDTHSRRRIPLEGGDSFTPIARGVDILQWMDIPVTVQINADARNVDGIPWLAHFVVERGWTKRDDFRLVIQPIDDRTLKGNVPQAMHEHELLRRLQGYWDQIAPVAKHLDLAALLTVLPHLASVFGFLGMDDQVRVQPIRRYGHYCWVTTEEATYYFGQDGLIYLCPVGVGIEQLAVGRFYPELQIHPGALRLWKGRNMFSHADCSTCRVGPLCGGGCTVTSMLLDPRGESKHCGDTFKVVDGFAEDMVLPVIRGDRAKK